VYTNAYLPGVLMTRVTRRCFVSSTESVPEKSKMTAADALAGVTLTATLKPVRSKADDGERLAGTPRVMVVSFEKTDCEPLKGNEADVKL
jgi:hypothetical protein